MDEITSFIFDKKMGRLTALKNREIARLKRKIPQSRGWEKTLRSIQKLGMQLYTVKALHKEISRAENGDHYPSIFKIEKGITYILGNSRDKDNSCTGKIPHATLEDAEKAATSFSKVKNTSFEGYKCRHCEFWHVGHSR